MNERELKLHQILSNVKLVLSVLIFIFVILNVADLWEYALHTWGLLLCARMIVSGILLRKSQRSTSIFAFCSAAVVFALCLLLFLS